MAAAFLHLAVYSIHTREQPGESGDGVCVLGQGCGHLHLDLLQLGRGVGGRLVVKHIQHFAEQPTAAIVDCNLQRENENMT